MDSGKLAGGFHLIVVRAEVCVLFHVVVDVLKKKIFS